MRILTRYMLAELAKVFLTTLTAMTLMMLILGVVAEATKQGLGPAQVGRLLPFILPKALLFTIPGTILFAVSLVYGRMSSSNEIVALKSAGISPMAVLWPAIVLAGLLSLLAVWLNDIALSWGETGMQRVVVESVEEIAYSMLRTQRAYSTKDFSMNVKGVDGKRLIRPTVVLAQKENRPQLTITAEWAEMTSDLKEEMLNIAFHNFTINGEGHINMLDPDTYEIAIPLMNASRADRRTMIPARMPMRIIPEKKAEHWKKLNLFRHEAAFRAATDFLTGDFAELASDEWKIREMVMGWDMADYHRLQTEPHRRWANGFSCLAFVVVGAATAIKRRNSDVLTSFFICFLPILIVYYPLFAFGLDSAKNGTLPPSSVWLGNLIMAAWGLKETRWVLRY